LNMRDARTPHAGRFPFTCPVCGSKTDYPVTELVEGANLTCSFCKLRLTLHGHMLEDVQKEIKILKMNMGRKSSSKKGCKTGANRIEGDWK
jgi:transcription elongation factor Elf1